MNTARPLPEELGDPRPLTEEDAERATLTISRAFAWHEPWGAWALPDPASRESTLAAIVDADLRERFLRHGECFTIAGLCVSLWIPPPSHPGGAAFGARRREGELRAYGDQAEVMRAADELLASLQPDGEHWYLDTIATEPERRRGGLGGRLLDHDLALRDAAGQSCALDTHTPDNVAFYERRGFTVTERAALPGDGPQLYVMVRPPGGS